MILDLINNICLKVTQIYNSN
uniref:Uncharacterized protein n=1 Tax=Arundo donax TaxID=35708 RepID=A0A0A9F1P3_ARUDO